MFLDIYATDQGATWQQHQQGIVTECNICMFISGVHIRNGLGLLFGPPLVFISVGEVSFEFTTIHTGLS